MSGNVVEGKAELAFVLISEILPIAGAEVAGPLPADLQNYVVFTGADQPAAINAGTMIGTMRLRTDVRLTG